MSFTALSPFFFCFFGFFFFLSFGPFGHGDRGIIFAATMVGSQ